MTNANPHAEYEIPGGAFDQLNAIRDLGFAVIAFTPEELRGADPEEIQDRLTEWGWDAIDALADPNQPNPYI
ncbi:MAG: hypothetical protein ACKODT_07070 [Fluviibacter sp.]